MFVRTLFFFIKKKFLIEKMADAPNKKNTQEGLDTILALKSLKNNDFVKEIVNEVYQIICIISVKQIEVYIQYIYNIFTNFKFYLVKIVSQRKFL
jgi:hypothetical protein